MNLDSYTRLNPYSDEEKGETSEVKGNTILIAAGISSALAFVAWRTGMKRARLGYDNMNM
ncbi:hypothetical protein B0T16DRAFT_461436 [Cercophora newfieldiana]|uniref:Uncharacterized protein n=1 Tax=Cercophora newfieldiana TaxID=92897 RepID=A0AA40CL12_9PEZI|nr:hypothetical protein B0T16DRAFT_461436 [Cercophora newfieldiana]